MIGKDTTIIVIAGPNGAGKSSLAPALLRDTLSISDFVNADVIAQGLSAFDPESVAVEAARHMLERLEALAREGRSFAFESTLAGKGVVRRIERYVVFGTRVNLNYLWLPSAEQAIQRVQDRVRAGGHHIPPAIVRRRFTRSLVNFDLLRRLPGLSWQLYDASSTSVAPLLARATDDRLVIHDSARWRHVQEQIRTLLEEERKVRESTSPYEVPPVEHEPFPIEAMTRAMVSTQANVVRLHRFLGLPLIIWRNGRVESVSAFDVPIPGEE